MNSPSAGRNSGGSTSSLYSFFLIGEPFTIATPTNSLWINTSLVYSGQTLYQAALLEALDCRIQSGTQEKCSALRKLDNKQRQVSMFFILLFKLLMQFPFVSFLSISILSLLPFSILSLLSLNHPSFYSLSS